MRLEELGALYLLVGLAAAVWIYRTAGQRGPRAVASAALAVPLWPLWAPIMLTTRTERRPDAASPVATTLGEASARIDAALREGVEACAGTPLESLLPRDAADRIAAEVDRAARRHAELEVLLAREGFDPAAAEARVAELERTGAPARALSTARLHLDNVRRLVTLRDRDARAIEELADLVQALRTQLVLARFAGPTAPGHGSIVAEMWARVEGLGVAMSASEDPAPAG